MVLFLLLLGLSLILILRAIFTQEHRQEKIIAILKTNDIRKEFWQTVAQGIHSAEKEFDVIVDIRGPLSETDIEEQIELLREAIAEKPDAIMLAPVDVEALVPAAEEVKKAGIRLIVIDMALQAGKVDSLVMTDHVDAGRKAGAVLAQQLKPNSKIVMMSLMKNYQVALLREQGVREALEAEYPHIEIVGSYFNYSEEETYAKTKVIFSDHKDLSGIIVMDSIATVGVTEALKGIELVNKSVKLVGFEGSINEIKLLEEGLMAAVVVRKPFNLGYLGIKAAVDLIRNPHSNSTVMLEPVVITQNNMYEPENQKILFPFVIR